MEKQETDLDNLNLNKLQVMSTNFPSIDTNRKVNLSRSLIKMYLNKSILEECLITFDIFKQILQDPLQKVKLIRDVIKNAEVRVFEEDSIIYNKGQQASQIYMVLKGTVALCMPVIIQNEELEPNDDRVQYEYQQIDTFQAGQGFGEAEFIHKRKRGLVARSKVPSTVIGCIHSEAFEEIIELYKQRIYYKKMDMFGKCSLLSNIQPYQLEFIVNNAKPVTFSISKQIVTQGEIPKALYLIIDGRVQLRRQEKVQEEHISKLKRDISKDKLFLNESKIKIKNVVIGSLHQGCYLGACQIALRQTYSFTAICTSQKVKAYVCDLRIIESQMNEQSFEIAARSQKLKKQYIQKKVQRYRDVKDQMQKDLDNCQSINLNQGQMKIKRKILNRYCEKKPTLVDELSPEQIGKSIGRKYARINTLQPLKQLYYIGSPSNFVPNTTSPVKKIVRNERALSPLLLKKSSEGYQRKYSEPSQMPIRHSEHKEAQHLYQKIELNDSRNRSETRPTIAFIRPFHRKVQTLHERLSRQYNIIKAEKEKQLSKKRRKKKNDMIQCSAIRLQEFISKIQLQQKQVQ